MTSDATITAAAAVRPQLLAPLRVAFADTGVAVGKTRVTFKAVSGSYFDVLDIPIVRGRTFMPSECDHHPVAIVSESVARALWPDGRGVGESFRIGPDAGIQAPRGLLNAASD